MLCLLKYELKFLRNKTEIASAEEIWAASWQNQQNDCAPSEDSDQPGHSPSLIRVVAVRMKKAWVLSYPLSAQRRLWSDWANAQADLSLRWAHSHFVGFVMRRLIYSCDLVSICKYPLKLIWCYVSSHWSRLMTKPTKWLRPCKTQISLGVRPVWSIFAMRSVDSWGPKISSCGHRRVWSDGADAQADLRLRWAHSHFYCFCHVADQIL